MPGRSSWRALLPILFIIVVVGATWSLAYRASFSAPSSSASPAEHDAVAAGSSHPPERAQLAILADPEQTLLNATDALLEARLGDAEAMLRGALQQEPHFRLAHALLGDLQRARAGMPLALHNASEDPALGLVRQEWQQRVHGASTLPPPDAWPVGLISFSPSSPHAFVVDAQTQRLYWLQLDDPSKRAPQVMASWYVSLGKAGVGKQIEGDNKTPLGVYRIVRRRLDTELPAFYGAGALVLDYPNAVDRLLGRTGSGIWLHGSPPDTYTRDPLASEGCVVLSNSDMQKLLQLPDVLNSPVLITSKLEWVETSVHLQQRENALKRLLDWARQQRGLMLDPTALGIQRWAENDGRWYWRVEYRRPGDEASRRVWFLREEKEGLTHVAGELPADTTDPATVDREAKEQSALGPPKATPPSANAERLVMQAVQSWAHAWSRRDVAQYLGHYHPHYAPAGMTRQAWQAQRRERIESKRHIRVEVHQPQIRVHGKRATVVFTQRYQADGQTELRARKTVILELVGDRWLIVQERNA